MTYQLANNSPIITGDCVSKDCPEGWTLECVPPTPEFPEGPPIITECLKFLETEVDDMYDVGDGIVCRVYGVGKSGGGRIIKYAYDFDTVIWTKYAPDFFPGKNNGFFPQGISVINDTGDMLVSIYDHYTVSGGSMVAMIDKDGNLLHTYSQDENGWNSKKSAVFGQNLHYHNGAVYASGCFTYQTQYTTSRFGFQEWNATTEELTRTVGAREARYDIAGLSTMLIPENNEILVAFYGWRVSSPGVVDQRGEMHKVDILTGTSTQIHQQPTLVSIGDFLDSYRFGGRIYLTSKYIAVLCAFKESAPNHKQPLDDESKWAQLEIFDRTTYAHIKTVINPLDPPQVIDSGNLGTGFGYSLHEYGNFIVIGSPSANKDVIGSKVVGTGFVGVFDSDFNFIYAVNHVPIAKNFEGWGSAVFMSSSVIYYNNMPDYSFAVDNRPYHVACSYGNPYK